jgi:TatD DNase family protein
MKLIDSHAHIYLHQFKDDLETVIDRSKDVGIEAIYMPNIDHTSIEDMLEIAARYQGYCLPMIGLHPCSVKKNFEQELYQVEHWLAQESFVAIGEMGTDLYWDKSFWEQQQEAFRIQIQLAMNHQLPFVIHCRDSIDETIDLIAPLNAPGLTGVFHCFTGTLQQAEKIIEMGFMLGIGGVSTFKNGGLEPVLEEIDLEHIMVETDSPYLSPVPYRGKRNEPSYVELVVKRIAEVKNVDAGIVAAITSQNSRNLFSKTQGHV